MLTGAAIYGGAHHLYHGVHNRAGHPHVIHAVMFFLLAGFALFSAGASTAHSAAELSLSGKLSVSLGILLFATLPWFVALLLKQRAGALPVVLTYVWGAFLLINIASPHSLLYQDITALNQIQPSGQPYVALHTAANPVWHLVEIAMLSTLICSMYLCLKQYRKAGKDMVIAPAAGLVLLLCTTLFDFFVHASLIHSAYLAPMGFLLFLITASLHRQPLPDVAKQQAREDTSPYQVMLNFNQAPVQAPVQDLQTVSTDMPADTNKEVTQPARLERNLVEDTVESQIRIDNPTVDRVSDGLVDIAVHATMILKRLEHKKLNAVELEELSRKVRTQAIETRRITYQMLRRKDFGCKSETD